MPKIRKQEEIEEIHQAEDEKTRIKIRMFNSAKITYLLALGFFVISFIFNGMLINGWVQLVNDAVSNSDGPTLLGIVDIIIKSLSIILFFFFGLISLGNYQELKGYVVNWKELVILLVLSLFQATTSGTVFIVSVLGISLILIYFYFMQSKVSSDY
jgi:hypothetical protein